MVASVGSAASKAADYLLAFRPEAAANNDPAEEADGDVTHPDVETAEGRMAA